MERNALVRMCVTLRDDNLNLFNSIDLTKKEYALVVIGNRNKKDETKIEWCGANAFLVEGFNNKGRELDVDDLVFCYFADYDFDNDLTNVRNWQACKEKIESFDLVEVIGYIDDSALEAL